MSQKILVSKLKTAGFESEDFNTNNAWGFGGGYGTSYKKDNIEVRIGYACYRHHPQQKFVTLTVDGIRLFDKESFKEITEYLINIKQAIS